MDKLEIAAGDLKTLFDLLDDTGDGEISAACLTKSHRNGSRLGIMLIIRIIIMKIIVIIIMKMMKIVKEVGRAVWNEGSSPTQPPKPY